MRSHLKSKVCKDTHYLTKVYDPHRTKQDEANDNIVSMYETNAPLPDVDLSDYPTGWWEVFGNQ